MNLLRDCMVIWSVVPAADFLPPGELTGFLPEVDCLPLTAFLFGVNFMTFSTVLAAAGAFLAATLELALPALLAATPATLALPPTTAAS